MKAISISYAEVIFVIIWQAILKAKSSSLIGYSSVGFYSTDHCHSNGPFGYFSLDRSAPGKFKP